MLNLSLAVYIPGFGVGVLTGALIVCLTIAVGYCIRRHYRRHCHHHRKETYPFMYVTLIINFVYNILAWFKAERCGN